MEARLVEADSLLRKNSAFPFITLEHLPPGTLPDEQFYYRKPTPIVSVPDNEGFIQLAPLREVEQERFYLVEKGARSYLLHFDKKLGNVIVLSAMDAFGETKMQNLKQVLLAGILLGTLAMGFISWYWPRRELRPISDKIKKARRIGGESLNLRLNVRNDYDELGELAITFNQMLDRIEKAFEAQKRFTSNAAHELRNPITAISGETQLALMQPRTVEEYRQTLERIKDKSDDLKKLVDRLLILARIESSTNKQLIRIDEILFDAIASVQSRHTQLSQLLQLHIQETDGNAYVVNGDPVMLKVAIDNIIENALKYGQDQSIHIHLEQEQGSLLTITDEGLGVTQEEMSQLFDLFYRNNRVRHIQGIGVGLPLVKSIIEFHGGTIRISPNAPKGTKVTIQLPNQN
jgi:signal transduction histidine kinase